MDTINTLDQRVIGNMLMRHVVTPCMQGKFSMPESSLIAIALILCHIEQNIAQTCHLCGDCDPKTLTRWEQDPDLGFPHHHKDPGGKHFWWLDEIEAWKAHHPDIIERVRKRRS